MNLKSTNLEPHLFKKVVDSLLERGVSVKEIVTDANNQIISILSKFSVLFCNFIPLIFVYRKNPKVSRYTPLFGCVAQILQVDQENIRGKKSCFKNFFPFPSCACFVITHN